MKVFEKSICLAMILEMCIRDRTITDHCECNVYREEEYDRSVRQSYFEARKASAVFHGRLHVRAGIELGQPMQNIEAAEDILDACDFDFTLASVHNVQGMPDFYESGTRAGEGPVGLLPQERGAVSYTHLLPVGALCLDHHRPL